MPILAFSGTMTAICLCYDAPVCAKLWCEVEVNIISREVIMQDLDGMKTARLLRERASDKILVLVSSSRQYVFDAYDVEAFQYLLKPVDNGKLKQVLQKAVLRTESHPREFILVSRERQKKKLFLDDVYYFVLSRSPLSRFRQVSFSKFRLMVSSSGLFSGVSAVRSSSSLSSCRNPSEHNR